MAKSFPRKAPTGITISISSAPASIASLHSVTFILLNVCDDGNAPATDAS